MSAGITTAVGTEPSTPAAGFVTIWVDTADKEYKQKDETGLVRSFFRLATSALAGIVPASGGGVTKFLRADFTWAVPAGGSGGNDLARFTANSETTLDTVGVGISSRNGHPIVAFDQTVDEGIIFHGIMSQDYSAGTMTLDMEFAGDGVTTGDVKWLVSWEAAPADLDVDSFHTAKTVTTTTSGTDGGTVTSTITFTQAEADGLAAGDPFRLKVVRDADDAGDTMTADAQLLSVHVRQ